jgi:hypothetical protein
MMPPDERVLKDANRIQGGAFHEFLTVCRQDSLERLAYAETEDVRFLQGEVSVFSRLITLVDGAKSDLEKKQNRPDMNGAF